MRKCVFFDRDGIVNESPGPGYVERWEDFHLIPAFVESLRVVTQCGYVAVLATNQRGVARGIMSRESVEEIHDNLQKQLKNIYGLELLDIMWCPHNNNECDCRKPLPGMLLSAAQKYNIDLPASWMVGDSITDIEAGRAAGCRTIYVGNKEKDVTADYIVAGMHNLPVLLKDIL